MLRTGNGVTTSLDLSNKNPNKKQKAGFYITDITKQDFRKLLKKFENSPYLGYKSKQVHNEPTEVSFLLIKQINNPTKSERKVRLRTKGVILGTNEKIVHIKKLDRSTKQLNPKNWKA